MAALAKSAPQAVQHIHFPNESPQYRRARNALLEQEMELHRQVERVAAQCQALPPGPPQRSARPDLEHVRPCAGRAGRLPTHARPAINAKEAKG
jgi:Bacterial protein of unknown function (DUF899)